jgi:hypothetical protein
MDQSRAPALAARTDGTTPDRKQRNRNLQPNSQESNHHLSSRYRTPHRNIGRMTRGGSHAAHDVCCGRSAFAGPVYGSAQTLQNSADSLRGALSAVTRR